MYRVLLLPDNKKLHLKNPDKLVCLQPYILVKYGLLYNYYAATDSRKITSSDTWVVPNQNNWHTLHVYLGGTLTGYPLIVEPNNIGGKLKEIGFVHWNTPNTDANNLVLFNSRGNGLRSTTFSQLNMESNFLSTTSLLTGQVDVFTIRYDSSTLREQQRQFQYGQGLRLVNNTTTLINGESGLYTGNDGKSYRTICIGTQEWLADNLCETQYRNGNTIPEETIDLTWWSLTTDALCAYNNDWTNV